MLKIIGIYKITSPSGKIYIGQSWNIKRRFARYKCGDCKKQSAIYRSFLKHGTKNHTFEIICELSEDITQEVLDRYEVLYWQAYKDCGIKMLNSKDPGNGGKWTEEAKERIRGANNHNFGKKRTQEKTKGKNNPSFGKVGELSPRHKLTEIEAIEIKIKYKPKIYSSCKLAREYNVTSQTIFDIVNGKSWKHLK